MGAPPCVRRRAHIEPHFAGSAAHQTLAKEGKSIRELKLLCLDDMLRTQLSRHEPLMWRQNHDKANQDQARPTPEEVESAPERQAEAPRTDPTGRRDSRAGYKIGYARVSTLDQNLALQQDALKEAGCEKIFIEQMSGAVTDRPALREALDYARRGDTLIVWKLDRLARSMKQLIETIESLRLRGIGFRSLTEAIDTTTAQGVLVFHMFSALAEFERALIRERTRAGLAAAKRAGRIGGRPRKLTEGDLNVARTLLANPHITVGDVAGRLGVSPPTLYRYLPPRGRQTALRPNWGCAWRSYGRTWQPVKGSARSATKPISATTPGLRG
jgi:DNA invertase Pin-like site-specific DNA recombinase